MKFLQTLFGYIKWHYGKAIISLFSIWRNITVFLFNYFSIKTLIGNFFSPWRRLTEKYPKWYEFKDFFSSLLVNTLMRLVGIVIRPFVIVLGLFTCLVFILCFPFVLLIWLIAPFGILALIFGGITLIIFG